MKFKTKQDLIKENKIGTEETNDIIHGIDLAFKSIEHRVKSFQKYQNNPNCLFQNEPAILVDDFKYWMNKNFPNSKHNKFKPMEYMRQHYDIYNMWLFQYCFGGIK